ncbi:plasmid pRiA4b ORF-3 family protein [Clostridium sp.]|uniref:plasmid pRiA4b ORF-3 family protein n=1 Tax=Clostridium sp. TaxID=1506 RepID=UPI002630BC36|nr:plasmid pRiA4b ORF-3 family protein [Clostridium sp.]
MKAYQIKITLEGSSPLIWRRVVVPAEITFKRLHDVIQFSMGWKDRHLYDFNLVEEKLRITGDEEAIAEYEFYSKMKLTRKNDPHGFIENVLKIRPKLSTKVKIDKYLSKDKSIQYIYDFGDYWKHDIVLEEIIDNYEYVYPTCVDGEGACPPEDVGGISGYMEFLKIMCNKNDPEYLILKEWVDSIHYKFTFNIENINEIMRHVLKLKRIKKIL